MRATYKVEVEVTAEVQSPGDYSNERLAEDLHDMVFTVMREETELDLVIMTVSPATANKETLLAEGPKPGDTLHTEEGDMLVQYSLETGDGLAVFGRWIADDYTIETLACHYMEPGDSFD